MVDNTSGANAVVESVYSRITIPFIPIAIQMPEAEPAEMEFPGVEENAIGNAVNDVGWVVDSVKRLVGPSGEEPEGDRKVSLHSRGGLFGDGYILPAVTKEVDAQS